MVGVAAAAQSASFALTLTTYADPAEMRGWLSGASTGDEMIYATGPAIGDHAAARCARAMADRGLVTLFQRRSGRPHCFDYCARKSDAAVKSEADAAEGDAVLRDAFINTLPSPDTRQQLSQLLGVLRKAAERGHPCPSHSETARVLGLPSPATRGRRRAQYLFERLEAEQRIAVTRDGTTRVVTITAKGRAHGKTTRSIAS